MCEQGEINFTCKFTPGGRRALADCRSAWVLGSSSCCASHRLFKREKVCSFFSAQVPHLQEGMTKPAESVWRAVNEIVHVRVSDVVTLLE